VTSPEVTTMDLTRAIKSAYARRTHQPRHRAPADTDRRAGIGVAVLLAAGSVGAFLVLHLIGGW